MRPQQPRCFRWGPTSTASMIPSSNYAVACLSGLLCNWHDSWRKRRRPRDWEIIDGNTKVEKGQNVTCLWLTAFFFGHLTAFCDYELRFSSHIIAKGQADPSGPWQWATSKVIHITASTGSQHCTVVQPFHIHFHRLNDTSKLHCIPQNKSHSYPLHLSCPAALPSTCYSVCS